MHRWLSLFLVLLIASPATSAQMRRWTGLNGKSIEGRLHRLQKDKVTFLTADGKLVTVALANLIEADRKRLTESPDNPQETSGFKQLPQADRSKIPELSSENLETPAMGSPAEALWISLLWWDATGVLPLPEKALKSKDPAAWLHEEILKVMHNGEK